MLSKGSKKSSSSCWKRGQTAKALLAPSVFWPHRLLKNLKPQECLEP